MNAQDLLKMATDNGLELQANGDKLKVKYQGSPPTTELVNLLRNHKADLLAYLAGQSIPRPASNHTAIQHPQHITGAYHLTSDQSRAMNGLWALLERRKRILISSGRSPDQAQVGVSDWCKAVMNRLSIGRDAMRGIEHSLIMAGLIKIDRHRNYVEPSDGIPMTVEQMEQADHTRTVWGGGDGADFVRWLYS